MPLDLVTHEAENPGLKAPEQVKVFGPSAQAGVPAAASCSSSHTRSGTSSEVGEV